MAEKERIFDRMQIREDLKKSEIKNFREGRGLENLGEGREEISVHFLFTSELLTEF